MRKKQGKTIVVNMIKNVAICFAVQAVFDLIVYSSINFVGDIVVSLIIVLMMFIVFDLKMVIGENNKNN